MWQALDRIISAKNSMEGIMEKEMYIRGFLDYERLVCEKDNHIWKMKMWQHKQIRPSVKAISHRRSLLSHLHKKYLRFRIDWFSRSYRCGTALLWDKHTKIGGKRHWGEIEQELRKKIYCAYVLHVLLLWFHCFLSYNMDTGGGLDEIQDFSCRWW